MTKYRGGHSDVVGGAVIARGAEFAKRARFHHNAVDAVRSPFDGFLVQRETLAERMERHAHDAVRTTEFLRAHARVAAGRSRNSSAGSRCSRTRRASAASSRSRVIRSR